MSNRDVYLQATLSCLEANPPDWVGAKMGLYDLHVNGQFFPLVSYFFKFVPQGPMIDRLVALHGGLKPGVMLEWDAFVFAQATEQCGFRLQFIDALRSLLPDKRAMFEEILALRSQVKELLAENAALKATEAKLP